MYDAKDNPLPCASWIRTLTALLDWAIIIGYFIFPLRWAQTQKFVSQNTINSLESLGLLFWLFAGKKNWEFILET